MCFHSNQQVLFKQAYLHTYSSSLWCKFFSDVIRRHVTFQTFSSDVIRCHHSFVCWEQYNIYIDACSQKNLCSGAETVAESAFLYYWYRGLFCNLNGIFPSSLPSLAWYWRSNNYINSIFVKSEDKISLLSSKDDNCECETYEMKYIYCSSYSVQTWCVQ